MNKKIKKYKFSKKLKNWIIKNNNEPSIKTSIFGVSKIDDNDNLLYKRQNKNVDMVRQSVIKRKFVNLQNRKNSVNYLIFNSLIFMQNDKLSEKI